MKVITRTGNQSAKEAAKFIIETVANVPWGADIKHNYSSAEAGGFEPEVARELKVQLLEKFDIEVLYYDFIEDLNIPSQVWRAIDGLDEWEDEVSGACRALIYAQKIKNFPVADLTAKAIGELISAQLLKGNYDAPIIVSKGLKNLNRGKSFRPQAGHQPSKADAMRIVIAFYYLKSIGIDKPTQVKVRESLGKHNISSGTVSKIFSKIGINTLAGDGRKANKPRQSKRKTSDQKLIRKHSIGL